MLVHESPYFGKEIYPQSRLLVTIGNYKKTPPFPGFSWEIFPRLRKPPPPPFPGKMGTHMRPLYAFERLKTGGWWGRGDYHMKQFFLECSSTVSFSLPYKIYQRQYPLHCLKIIFFSQFQYIFNSTIFHRLFAPKYIWDAHQCISEFCTSIIPSTHVWQSIQCYLI